jgi:hypothetical protein
VFVLGLDTLPTPLTEKLLQHSWPHCGKIGRYVSHRARSLTGPTNVWFADGTGCTSGGALGKKVLGRGTKERIGVQPR